ncbi:hypothetical protein Ssi02_70910 [Sinosporangium siamense]|uniref:Uncharacterized protein n=1 Tax=Sinosporangium siamense TaxID=1367973 RepID=A0A919RPW9_9ACTN|nr:hypothetical protein Ssi02_70910 [Sinosporangium siamense]
MVSPPAAPSEVCPFEQPATISPNAASVISAFRMVPFPCPVNFSALVYGRSGDRGVRRLVTVL